MQVKPTRFGRSCEFEVGEDELYPHPDRSRSDDPKGADIEVRIVKATIAGAVGSTTKGDFSEGPVKLHLTANDSDIEE